MCRVYITECINMETDYENVKCLFPSGTKIIHFTGSPDKYTALLRGKCKSKEEFRQDWLKEYEKLSRVTMRVLLTRPKTGKTVVYKATFRCQHNTYPTSHQRVKAPHKKHTGCPAILKVTIKASPENRRVRSIDTLRREYPTVINITHEHNHLLPSKINLCQDHYISWNKKTKAKFSEINCGTFPNIWVERELKKDEKFQMEEPNWNFVKCCWSSFLEKCELSNSIHLYRALLKAITCLESCKSVNATISALNSVRKKINNKNYDTKALVQEEQITSTKKSCSELNNVGLPVAEVSNAVDELLVIDQGWVM